VEANGYLQTRERAAPNATDRERWARLRVINDQAYFVMMFACLAGRIDELCDKLVRRKMQQRSWRARRRWTWPKLKDLERVPFMERVSWLVKTGGTEYNAVKDLYDTRCDIAHGAFARVRPLNIPSFYQQIRAVWRALRP